MTAASSPACHAPFTSLHLDPHGVARACCQNSWFRLGRYPDQSLEEIWNGRSATELRQRLLASDFSAGCNACAPGSLDDLRGSTYARRFDHLEGDGGTAPWPVQLELQLSTRCNLLCTMCTGQSSSSIRAKRERLPPLPKVYDDAFFEQLAHVLPYVRRIELLGGEPFLAEETKALTRLLTDLDLEPRFHITTNGTVWTPWVEEFLDRFPADITISIEGSTPAVFESIRVGAAFEEVLRNVDRFCAAVRPQGDVSVATCLMRESLGDLHGLLELADERDLDVYVNTLVDPATSSVAAMEGPTLAAAVEAMEAQAEIRPLGRNRSTWEHEIQRLRTLADRRTAAPADPRTATGRGFGGAEAPAPVGPSHTFYVDRYQILVGIDPDPTQVFGLDLTALLGEPLVAWLEPLCDRYGDVVFTDVVHAPDGTQRWMIVLDGVTGSHTVFGTCTTAGETQEWLVQMTPGPSQTAVELPTQRSGATAPGPRSVSRPPGAPR